MIRFILLLPILFFSLLANAQVNYENTYSLVTEANFYLINLGNSNYKYAIINYKNSEFSLYNLNHTPFMLNISVPLLDTVGTYDVGYITSSLFDCDSTNIEYAIMPLNASETLYIYRTDGTVIFSKDSVIFPYCYGCAGGSMRLNGINNTPTGTKMFLFNYFNQYFVYGLCGTLPESIEEINQSNSYVRVFPNPSSNEITFQIIPPSNYEKHELIIFNSSMQTLKTSLIDRESKITLDSKSLSSGAYFYSLQNKNKVFQTGKFVLTK